MQSTTLHRLTAIGGAALLALALSAATVMGQNSNVPTTPASYVPPSDSITGQSMLETLTQASREEIRQAQAALGSTRNPAVRNFAEELVRDHTAALADVNTLWTRLGYPRADSTSAATLLPPGMSDTSRGLGAGAFPGTPGDASADRGYVNGQVTAHQNLLAQLQAKERLVSDPQVRALTADMRVTVERHLASAKNLNISLSRTP